MKDKKWMSDTREILFPVKKPKKPKPDIMEIIFVVIISWAGIVGVGWWLYEFTGIKEFTYPLGATILVCVEAYKIVGNK